ncbi:MAG: hypothetical protein GY772_26975 [bacterium]|nr:hypothetical protein [bacterium]
MGGRDGGVTGRIGAWGAGFLQCGGYDEQLEGMGFQDMDLYHRLGKVPGGGHQRLRFQAGESIPNSSDPKTAKNAAKMLHVFGGAAQGKGDHYFKMNERNHARGKELLEKGVWWRNWESQPSMPPTAHELDWLMRNIGGGKGPASSKAVAAEALPEVVVPPVVPVDQPPPPPPPPPPPSPKAVEKARPRAPKVAAPAAPEPGGVTPGPAPEPGGVTPGPAPEPGPDVAKRLRPTPAPARLLRLRIVSCGAYNLRYTLPLVMRTPLPKTLLRDLGELRLQARSGGPGGVDNSLLERRCGLNVAGSRQ